MATSQETFLRNESIDDASRQVFSLLSNLGEVSPEDAKKTSAELQKTKEDKSIFPEKILNHIRKINKEILLADTDPLIRNAFEENDYYMVTIPLGLETSSAWSFNNIYVRVALKTDYPKRSPTAFAVFPGAEDKELFTGEISGNLLLGADLNFHFNKSLGADNPVLGASANTTAAAGIHGKLDLAPIQVKLFKSLVKRAGNKEWESWEFSKAKLRVLENFSVGIIMEVPKQIGDHKIIIDRELEAKRSFDYLPGFMVKPIGRILSSLSKQNRSLLENGIPLKGSTEPVWEFSPQDIK